MLRRRTLERRLFGWLLAFALTPALLVLALATWIWTGSLDRVSALGPWTTVAESGRIVLEAAQNAAARDSALAAALEQHRDHLSASLMLAHRWAFLTHRLAGALPFLALVLAVVLAALALAGARKLARDLARPIRELVEWTERLAREEPLPPPGPHEAREVVEVRALRAALRRAANELAEARRRALEAERVRIWGEMARRVAHEMKNPLTPLRLAAHRLARSQGRSPDWEEPVAVIIEETERLEDLAQQFAALGRPPSGPTSAIDIRELMAGLLATDVPPGVVATLESADDLPLVEGHYDALLRAFRNLIRNAVEAMEGSERPRRIDVGIHVTDGMLVVAIGDTGSGLPEGAGDRIFEPDYTTKSRGTGLGLALVRQAVAAHGGEVLARNRPGGGAEFVVRLPAAAAAPAGRA